MFSRKSNQNNKWLDIILWNQYKIAPIYTPLTNILQIQLNRCRKSTPLMAQIKAHLHDTTNHCTILKGRVQSVCKQSLCLHFGIQNIDLYSTTIYIFMLQQY
jgi:hypothetical protein